MSKQKLNKLISVLLALAICSATVFGCLITVNAAEDPSCTIANGVVSGDSKTATVDVTFTAPGGISAGEFAVDANEKYFTGVTAKVIAGTPLNAATDGAFDAADFTITHTGDLGGETDLGDALEVILFETKKVITGTDKDGNEIGHLKPYTSVTFQLTYTLVDGAVVKGTDIPVSISDIVITDQNGGQINISETTAKGTIETGCDHIITVSGDPIKTDAANGYAVYENGVCSLCGKNFGYQVVPTAKATATTENVIYDTNYGASDGSFMSDTEGGTIDNPYIIKTVDNLVYLVRDATLDQTKDKFFTVDNGIDAIVLQSAGSINSIGKYFSNESNFDAGLAALKNMTAAQAEAFYSDNNNGSKWYGQRSDGKGVFAGTIDFNGATVYGLKAAAGGLFSHAYAGATFKNLTVKGAYAIGDAAGVIAAQVTGNGVINIENCTVANSAVVCTRRDGATAYGGVMIGACLYPHNTIYNIDNCLVYGNTAKHKGYYDTITGYDITYGLFGRVAQYNGDYSTVKNSIILDCVPHATYSNYDATEKITYSNIYTNVIGQTIINIDFYSNGKSKYRYTLTPTIDSNGKYTSNINEYDLTNDKATGTIRGEEPAGSIIAASKEDVSGVNACNIISKFDDSWAYTVDGYPTPLAAYIGAVSTEASRDFALKAVNLTYEDSGNFSINFHYEPPYAGFAPTLYVAKATENGKFRTLIATPSSEAGKGLSDNAVMYTLSGLSATEIGDKLLATAIDGQNAIKLWGKTEQISIKDYAISVISGEGVYTDGATAVQKQADKDVAAAVINYGKAAKGIRNDYTTPTKTRIEYWDGGVEAPTAGEDGVYIIDNAANLAYIAKNENNDTSGNTYKVADDIKAIVLQREGSAADAIMNLSSATEVKTYFENEENKKSLYKWLTSEIYTGNGFAGTFDGNGATIYGVYNVGGNSTGLFSGANGITVKNVAIKNSYLAGDAAAVICGRSASSAPITVEKCEIANNVVIASRINSGSGFGGVMFGFCVMSENQPFKVDGCLVYGNSVTHTPTLKVNGEDKSYNITYGLWGSMGYYGGVNPTVTNSIVLDNPPYSMTDNHTNITHCTFNNVYTNMVGMTIENSDWTKSNGGTDADTAYNYKMVSTINANGTTTIKYYLEGAESSYNNTGTMYKVDHADVLGIAAKTNCPNFDWSNWTYGLTGNYPTFANDDINALYDTEGTTLYWDGETYTEPTTKDAKGNYIIDTAAKLAYLACKTKDKTYETHGKTYKVADGIDAIVLQPESLSAIKDKTSAAEVKAFFDENAGAAKWWNVIGYNGAYPFQGTFDGNGATIYGIYANWASYADWHSDLYAGLFGLVDQGAVIKNVAVKNSYLTSKNGFIGAIFANSARATTDWNATANRGTGDIVVENCVSANNYMYAPSTDYSNRNKFGVLVGASSYDYLKMNNCIAYGNDATTGITTPDSATFDIPFIGGLNGDKVDEKGVNSVTNIITLGATPYNRYDFGWGSYVHHEGSGTGTNCFENVYTDQPLGYFTMYNGSSVYKDYASSNMGGLIGTTANDLKGDKGAAVVEALNTANGGKTVWYKGNAWGYPGFKEADIMPAANQSAYNALSLKVSDNYGASTSEFGMYGTSLSLKDNPYIGFTFAFSGDYKANRKNITVTFTTASGIVINTKVANEEGELNAGWTNNKNAGRYHLYKLTDVPAKDLCKPITVTVSYGDNNYDFGSFSAEGFALDAASAYNQNPCAYYSTRYEAAKALLFYSQMLDARYGKA